MTLSSLNILNYRNIREASLAFSAKLNCLVGLNGQGKTNVLDAIYLLSFTKSAYTSQDSLNITHGEQMAMVQGTYSDDGPTIITCGLHRGRKKQFRRDRKDYKRLIEHIGLIPLVMVSPADHQLIEEGSDERRRFMDSVIAQLDKQYLDDLTRYNALLKQRNALLKQVADAEGLSPVSDDLFEVLEEQMIPLAQYIFQARTDFIEAFEPYFAEIYNEIANGQPQTADSPAEIPVLRYESQLQNRDLRTAYQSTRQRDLILGWTSQGVHKDELRMQLGDFPLKQVGSQGQQRTFVLAMKLAQAIYLSSNSVCTPILLLDDIFDRLDSERVSRIVRIVQRPEFGQIFITDTDRQHLTEILRPDPSARIFYVADGRISLVEND